MGVIETRTFKSGNSVAVRLPKELGLEVGARVTIRRVGDKLEIAPRADAAEEKQALLDMTNKIRAIWDEAGGPPEPQPREPIEFPDRPGLY
jgi:antitoxin VapB